jgi:hypothetical protein
MKPQESTPADARSTQPGTRKAYQKPQLQVYVDLTEITQNIAGSMAHDGAGHPNKHFTK